MVNATKGQRDQYGDNLTILALKDRSDMHEWIWFFVGSDINLSSEQCKAKCTLNVRQRSMRNQTSTIEDHCKPSKPVRQDTCEDVSDNPLTVKGGSIR